MAPTNAQINAALRALKEEFDSMGWPTQINLRPENEEN